MKDQACGIIIKKKKIRVHYFPQEILKCAIKKRKKKKEKKRKGKKKEDWSIPREVDGDVKVGKS